MTITREQVERAIEGMRDDAGAKPDHLAYADSPVWDDGPLPTPTPERPAPRFKVVDVPQPRIVVKRCDEVEAEWTSADATILIVTHDALDDAIFVPIALLRAMLADIDAQQGGAS